MFVTGGIGHAWPTYHATAAASADKDATISALQTTSADQQQKIDSLATKVKELRTKIAALATPVVNAPPPTPATGGGVALSGTGETAAEPFHLKKGLVAFHATHDAEARFALELYSSHGKLVDRLVNVNGYSGRWQLDNHDHAVTIVVRKVVPCWITRSDGTPPHRCHRSIRSGPPDHDGRAGSDTGSKHGKTEEQSPSARR